MRRDPGRAPRTETVIDIRDPDLAASRGGSRERNSDAAAGLVVRGLEKTYGRGIRALRGIDLEVSEGEFVTLLGPSGSGKTTLLMVIGGFESPSRGQILVGENDITSMAPERRNFGVVFQNYALFPHMSVRGNVGYPLAVRRIRRSDRRAMVEEALSLVSLRGLEDRRPHELSGGQQQRVALARALVYHPSMLLLDEPLGALDRALRERMQMELRRLHQKTGVTFLYVTHDQEEALTMSDRIVVLRLGEVEQVGTPEELYARPATEFVATFVGSANQLRGRSRWVRDGVAEVRLDLGSVVGVPCSSDLASGMDAVVVVRPEKVDIVAGDEEERGDRVSYVEGRVEGMVFAGSTWRYQVATRAGVVHCHAPVPSSAVVGDSVRLRWSCADGWAIPADGPVGARFHEGDAGRKRFGRVGKPATGGGHG